jgi:hypothetical protein
VRNVAGVSLLLSAVGEARADQGKAASEVITLWSCSLSPLPDSRSLAANTSSNAAPSVKPNTSSASPLLMPAVGDASESPVFDAAQKCLLGTHLMAVLASRDTHLRVEYNFLLRQRTQIHQHLVGRRKSDSNLLDRSETATTGIGSSGCAHPEDKLLGPGITM